MILIFRGKNMQRKVIIAKRSQSEVGGGRPPVLMKISLWTNCELVALFQRIFTSYECICGKGNLISADQESLAQSTHETRFQWNAVTEF